MPTPELIPKATITTKEANIVAWRKHTGEAVLKDEILFEMETDKVVVEVPSPASDLAAATTVQDAIDFALSSPQPGPESIYQGIYADKISIIGGSGPKRSPGNEPSGSF